MVYLCSELLLVRRVILIDVCALVIVWYSG